MSPQDWFDAVWALPSPLMAAQFYGLGFVAVGGPAMISFVVAAILSAIKGGI